MVVAPVVSSIPPGEKGSVVNFQFIAKIPHHYSNSKDVVLVLSDSINNEVVSQIDIPFSADSVYSSFKLSLLKDNDTLDFGPLAVSAVSSREFVIENTGVFPFDFEISPKIEVTRVSRIGSAKGGLKGRRKTATPKPATAKGKLRRVGAKDFQIGYFTVLASTGTIAPGQSHSVPVSFQTTTIGAHDKVILLKVSDTSPKRFPQGFPIKLHGECCAPAIEVSNFEKIFPGTHLCLRYDLTFQEITSFLEDDLVLHFAPTVLHQKATVILALINSLPIPCTVELSFKLKIRTSPSKSPFDISEKLVQVDPKSTKEIKINFSPTSTQMFSAAFEATVKGALNTSMKSLKFGIEGSGIMPMISVFEAPENKSRKYSYTFGKTLVNSSRDKMVIIQNIGVIPTILTVTANNSPDFELLGFENSRDVSIKPKGRLPITVRYCPAAIRQASFSVQISVQNNSNMDVQLNFQGEGFSENIIFEGLPANDSDLIFTDCVVGRSQQLKFIMRNISSSDCRFAWTHLPEVTFSPRIGQLRACSSKEITATFHADKPIKVQAETAICQLAKIQLRNPQSPDWDDSMKIIKFMERGSLIIQPPHTPQVDEKARATPRKMPGAVVAKSGRQSLANTSHEFILPKVDSKSFILAYPSPRGSAYDLMKVVDVKEEPAYDVIHDKLKEFTLKVFAVADVIQYHLSVHEIEFLPTMMFETRIVKFTITNSSHIRFEYSWITIQFGGMRTDYAMNHKSPFAILPASGFIEAGKTTTFEASFTPEEVDDFSVHMRCEIPFLGQLDPPQIYMSGRSRRPICHFNLKCSDYLSAGRRHPNYTYPLPEGVKVIEMFAHKIGERVIFRFEIINTTEAPYEGVWTRVGKADDSAITCNTPNPFISSGKRHVACFMFIPVSAKTLESLWHFAIPEYDLHVHLLVVGRIMPP